MHILTYICFTLSFFTLLVQDGWKKEFEKEGITVYTKAVENSNFKAFKGEMIIESNVDDLIPIILDVENYPEWNYRTSLVRLLRTEKNKIFYHYISETPLVVKDREAYFCSEITIDKQSKTTTVKMNIVESSETVPKGFVRMPFSDGYWKFTSMDDERTFVRLQMHADPGGLIPSWLANLASTEAPWITLNNLRKIVEDQ